MTQPLPEQPQVDADEQQSLRDRLNDRKVLAAIGAAVVVVAALGLFVVKPMLSGSSSSDSSFTVPHHAAKAEPSASAAASAPAVAATPAPQLKVRDPFSPLVVPVTAAASPSSTTAAAQPTTPTIVVVQPSASPTNATYSLKLDKVVDAKTVQLTLNGKQRNVVLSQSFPDAQNGPFQLTYVSPATDASHSSAQFAYGDETFSLATGETKTEN